MKKYFAIFILVMLCGVQNIFAQQSETYVNPYTYSRWNNAISSYLDTVIYGRQEQTRSFNQQIMADLGQAQMWIGFGKDRIAKGKARTAFPPDAKNSVIEKAAAQIEDPAEKQKTINAYREMFKAFQTTMTENGLRPYDLADARALAFVISYQIVNDEFPGKKRLEVMRQKLRKDLLADNYYQGRFDDFWQSEYEKLAINTIIAVYADAASRKKDASSTEKKEAEQRANEAAKDILTKIWKNSAVGTIEMTATGFGNKAERLVKSGTGLTTFRRDGELAAQTNSDEQTAEYRELIGKFDEKLKQRGGETNDLAFANAVAFAINYMIASDDTTILNDRQFKWVLNEMIDDMTKGSQATFFQGLTDAQKQSSYENLAVEAMQNLRTFENVRSKMGEKSDRTTFGSIFDRADNESDLSRVKQKSYWQLETIFKPREFREYEITNDGFRKTK